MIFLGASMRHYLHQLCTFFCFLSFRYFMTQTAFWIRKISEAIKHKARICYHESVQKDSSPEYVPSCAHHTILCSLDSTTPVRLWVEDRGDQSQSWLPALAAHPLSWVTVSPQAHLLRLGGGLSPFQQVCIRPHLLLWALRSVTLTRLWGQPSWPLEPGCLISHGFEPACGHIPSSSLPQHARCQVVFPKSYGISAQHSFQLKNIFKTFERKCIAFFWLSRRHTACRKFD